MNVSELEAMLATAERENAETAEELRVLAGIAGAFERERLAMLERGGMLSATDVTLSGFLEWQIRRVRRAIEQSNAHLARLRRGLQG